MGNLNGKKIKAQDVLIYSKEEKTYIPLKEGDTVILDINGEEIEEFFQKTLGIDKTFEPFEIYEAFIVKNPTGDENFVSILTNQGPREIESIFLLVDERRWKLYKKGKILILPF